MSGSKDNYHSSLDVNGEKGRKPWWVALLLGVLFPAAGLLGGLFLGVIYVINKYGINPAIGTGVLEARLIAFGTPLLFWFVGLYLTKITNLGHIWHYTFGGLIVFGLWSMWFLMNYH